MIKVKIIKIGSTWCSGCIVMKPIWEEIEKEKELHQEYFDYDIYEDMLKEKYHIGDKLPIVLFLDNNNNELERIIGETSKETLLDLINKYGDK